ncbi:MAG: hypothetical protein L0Z54_06735, partial [Thermoplasmata archaeon]|nr:hypothetical protein [Thermoplasmata archaeon]
MMPGKTGSVGRYGRAMKGHVGPRCGDLLLPALAIAAVLASMAALLSLSIGTTSADVNIQSITVTPATREILPGTSGNFYVGITLVHTGGSANVTATLNLDAGKYHVWFDGDDKEVEWNGVDISRTINVTVKVSVEPGTPTGSLPFQVDLDVESANASNPADIWDLQSLSWEASVKQVYDLTVECDEATAFIDRGDQTIFDIDVTNVGNGPDTVQLAFSINGSQLASTIKMGSDIVNETTINGSQFATLSVNIDSFETTVPKLYTAVFYAYSEDDVTVATMELHIQVNATYGVGLASPRRTKSGAFGQDVVFTLYVENRGDGPDSSHVMIDAGTLEDNASLALWSTSGMKAVDVPFNSSSASHIVEVTVSVPDRETFAAIFGNDTVESTRLSLRANSNGDPSNIKYMNFTIDIVPVRGMNAFGIATNATVDPYTERNAMYSIRIVNTGTRTDTYTIDITSRPQNVEVAYNYTGSDVLAGSALTLNVTAALPTDDDLVTPGNFTIGVMVTADSDSGLASNFTLGLDVLEYHLSFDLSGVITTAALDPGTAEAVDFSVRVVNDGLRDDAYAIEVTGNPYPSRLIITTDYGGSMVSRGEGVLVNVTVTPSGSPIFLRAGDHALTFMATSQNDATMNATVELDLEILAHHVLSVATNSSSISIMPGTPARYAITVTNRGNIGDLFDVAVLDEAPGWGWTFLEHNGTGGPGTTSIDDIVIPWNEARTIYLVANLTEEEALEAFDPSPWRNVSATVRIASDMAGQYDIVLVTSVLPTYAFDLVDVQNTTLTISSDRFSNGTFWSDAIGRMSVLNAGNVPDQYIISSTGGA